MKKVLLVGAFVVAGAMGFAQGDCCGDKVAEKKAQETVNGKPACCKSTEAKPMAKGEKGCCNAKGELAKFKVYVVGVGYKFFGCEGSAAKGREEIVAAGQLAGKVQKVVGKHHIS